MPSLNFVLSSAIITISVVLYNNIGDKHKKDEKEAAALSSPRRSSILGAVHR
jgi:hypothetical protein